MRRHLVAAGAALVLVTGLNGVAHAQTAPAAAAVAKPMDAAERRDVIEKLATALKANFLFPDTGARYAGQLRANLASGAYDGLTDPAAFGEKVTSDLQAVAKLATVSLRKDHLWPFCHLKRTFRTLSA